MVAIALTVAFLIALVPMSPLLAMANLYPVDDGNSTVLKCFTQDLSDVAVSWFGNISWSININYAYEAMQFTLAYLIPLIIISIMYGLILNFVWMHVRQSKVRSRIHLIAVAKKSLLIIAFYFLCWTPYWLAHIARYLICE